MEQRRLATKLGRRHWNSLTSYLFRSITSCTSINHVDETLQPQVLVQENAHSCIAILNRPYALNALTAKMGSILLQHYKSWENNPNIGFVTLKGNGRAFCAGGDIVSLFHLINKGNTEACREFFTNLYSFIYVLGTYLKPHVAVLNGVTMGGGAGVSVPGTLKLATDKTVFATPETGIGFHPDAGASFYLSRLPGSLGEYLALTGATLTGSEMVACGLATHYASTSKLKHIEQELEKLVTDDPSTIETLLEKHGDEINIEKYSVLNRLDIVDKCFRHDCVEEIIESLETEASAMKDEWCTKTLRLLKEASPLGLKVALKSVRKKGMKRGGCLWCEKQIRMGRDESLHQCLNREYMMSLQGVCLQISPDFCEGVRARMVDKDSAPKWNPPTLDLVTDHMVDRYFSPLSEAEPGLPLPTKEREAFL